MNVETPVTEPSEMHTLANTTLLKAGTEGLDSFLENVATLKEVLGQLADIGDENTGQAVRRLREQLDSFEPTVTMIGQVKAGKTSLVNAMVGWPDLLPADVNPWTSVVTSLHMTPKPQPNGNSSLFKFFDENEWNRLLVKGGRIGELAERAGAEEELETVRQQVEQMREKSRIRLGKRFEMLLGQEHDYGYFDQDLIERYVCLGDDFENDDGGSDTQGRFADITKSAQLYMHRPEFPTNLCIRDTPGVNDTFMMREQITIRAIRDSRLCVVVLSAHQALSSVDMALIRLISNIKAREVVIFVNRIDELSDPTVQVPEIRKSITETIKAHDGPVDAQIIFGSAYWANLALSGSLQDMAPDSAKALTNWSGTENENGQSVLDRPDKVWERSGIPALFSALTERISEGIGQDAIDKVARQAVNLANGLHATNQVVSPNIDALSMDDVDKDKIAGTLDQIQEHSLAQLKNEFERMIEGFHGRIDRSHRSFLERATAALIGHLEKNGEDTPWHYDPAGLRVLLRSGYRIFGSRAQSASQKIYDSAATEICEIYARNFGNLGAEFNIEPPTPPVVPAPVFLGQTIALDLKGSWWRKWWQRRRSYKEFAISFHSLIKQETDPIVDELKFTQAHKIRDEAVAILNEFLTNQRDILMGVAVQADASSEELTDLLGVQDHQERKDVVQTTLSTLNQYVA